MSEVKKSIIFSGGIFRDLVAYTERFPKVGETIFGSKFKMGFGGKSANQVRRVITSLNHYRHLGSTSNPNHQLDVLPINRE
jgi:hypothetical protein